MQGSCGSHLQAELRAGRSVRLCYRLQHGDQCCSHKFVILDHEYTCQGLVLLAPLPAPVSTSRWRCGRGHDETNLVSLNVRRLSAYESVLAPIGVPNDVHPTCSLYRTIPPILLHHITPSPTLNFKTLSLFYHLTFIHSKRTSPSYTYVARLASLGVKPNQPNPSGSLRVALSARLGSAAACRVMRHSLRLSHWP